MTTQDDIIQRINNRLTTAANLLEGGFSQDIIGSVAYELANIYDTELNEIADRVFVATAQGEDLDKVGADYGIARREAQAAIVNLVITGNNNATINENVMVTYNNVVFQVQEYKKISGGSATVKAKCTQKGVVGNVPANTLTRFVGQYAGLTGVNNPAAAYDGLDKEDDETYRARIMLYLSEDATNANEAQYRQWALSVAGVNSAVIQSAEIMGAGKVGVYISAVSGTVTNTLKNAVKNYIETVQPINAQVVVNALTNITINVNATVELADGYTTDAVITEFSELLTEYLKTVDNTVSYFRISELLYACSGVEDVISYTLNGDTESIDLAATDFPVLGGVVIVTE